MQIVSELAEKVNSTNYAAMSYNELVTINFAFLLALGEVKPLMEKKRAEEMDAHTHEYVAKMNNYGASKAEILASLEKEATREYPYGPLSSQDVDEQTPTSKAEDNQDKGEDLLALPEPQQAAPADIAEKTPFEVSAVENLNNDAILDNCTDGDAINEENDAIQTDEISSDSPTGVEPIPSYLLAEAAIEIAKKGHLPDDVDINAPYFVDYTIRHDGKGDLWRDSIYGRNLDVKDLELFRFLSEKHVKLLLKREIMMSSDDCLVFRKDTNLLLVRFYHFPKQGKDGENTSKPNTESYSNRIPYDAIVDLHKTHRRMKNAIEKAKEYTASVGSTNASFYDKYEFCDNNFSVKLKNNQVRIVEDAKTIHEIVSVFGTYARLYSKRAVAILEDNCLAVKEGSTIYVLVPNYPGQERPNDPTPKKRNSIRKKSEPATKNDAMLEKTEREGASSPKSVQTLILEAVDMTKRLPQGDKTNDSSPYYVQREFIVTGDGEVVPKTKPFSKNVSGNEEFAGIKKKHSRFARTMKASAIVSTDEYTAFIWNEGRSLTVFYYYTNTQAETDC